jgi:hypothetical protein
MHRFLDLTMMTTEIYPKVLQRLQAGEKFLDLGCCFGQEIRQLVFDGAPSVNTYGSDLWDDFFSIGYELFRDKDRLQTTFIAANVFDDSSPLTKLSGQMNIAYTGDLFHLFNLEQQEQIALRIVQLLAPQPDSIIIGRQSGSEVPGHYARSGTNGPKHFRHNPESWAELWDRVGERTGSRWLVEATMRFPEFISSVPGTGSAKQGEPDSKGLRYTIKRL